MIIYFYTYLRCYPWISLFLTLFSFFLVIIKSKNVQKWSSPHFYILRPWFLFIKYNDEHYVFGILNMYFSYSLKTYYYYENYNWTYLQYNLLLLNNTFNIYSTKYKTSIARNISRTIETAVHIYNHLIII